ncbi:hypothetical protein GF369_00310 [Candidatus Peregrinibacteria bacterium]|nr:hypothetical protein [Candidatus Peregrinibacteria bacterium]
MKRYILYSNIIWKQPDQNKKNPSPEDSAGSSPEAAHQPNQYDVDLVVRRGTVSDFINKRVNKVLNNERKKLAEGEIKGLTKELEAQKKVNEKLQEQVEILEKEKARLDHDIASTSERVNTLENADTPAPEDLKVLESRLAAVEGQKYPPPQEIKDLREDFNDLLNDNSALHKQLAPLLSLPKTVKELEEKIDRVGANPQAMKEFLVRITAKMSRIEKKLGIKNNTTKPEQEPKPDLKPDPSRTPREVNPGNEGFIDKEKQKKGIKATPMANKIYKALKDRMGAGWKFTAPYHHAKCWKYYNVRPGSDVTGEKRRNTDEKYCIFDGKDYYYTDAWYEKLIKELPTKWEEIKRYKPTN